MEREFGRSQVNFMNRTLLTMSLGLIVTFAIAIMTPMFLTRINSGIMFAAMIVELGLVFFLVRRIDKMSVASANMWFFIYAALNGFTLSTVFYNYNIGKASLVFAISAAMFFCSAMIGMTTKKDLGALGQFLMMAVIGLIIMTLVQVFFHLQGLSFLVSVLGIFIFCGLTAYDMQNVKKLHSQCYNFGGEQASKFAVIAALQLYLDFINIFLYVLQLFNDND